jgi:hypothetical protein
MKIWCRNVCVIGYLEVHTTNLNAPRDRHRRGHLPDGVLSWTARFSNGRGSAGMIDWTAGPSSSPTATPVSWCSSGAWWRADPLGMLWPEMPASSGEDDRGGRSVTVAQRPRGVGEFALRSSGAPPRRCWVWWTSSRARAISADNRPSSGTRWMWLSHNRGSG